MKRGDEYLNFIKGEQNWDIGKQRLDVDSSSASQKIEDRRGDLMGFLPEFEGEESLNRRKTTRRLSRRKVPRREDEH